MHIESLLRAGATTDQIAERIGVTANAIREITAGRTKAPRAEAAFKLVRLSPVNFVKQTRRKPNRLARPRRTQEGVISGSGVLPDAERVS